MNASDLSAAIAPLNLRSCLVHRQGELVFHYERERHMSTQPAKINSCTKSILSALICIAMERGLVPEPDTAISRFFPQLLRDADERKRHITLRHLLTLTAGFDWTEFGGSNSFPRMTRSSDWVAFTLAQPMAESPGARMVYNSGVSQLLAAVLTQATGMSVARFAELHLFAPLGIASYEWERDPQGVHTGGFGLKLAPEHMLKFGLLYLQRGSWHNRQIIAAESVERSTQAAIAASAPDRGFYGWHWWTDSVTSTTGESVDFYYARGFGGQLIYILPDVETVVVLTRDPRKKGPSALHIFREKIAPSLIASASPTV